MYRSIQCRTRVRTAIAHLLEHLNAAEFTYPGTKMQLVYSIAGEAETPNSVPQRIPQIRRSEASLPAK